MRPSLSSRATTLVALMAAHREAAQGGRTAPVRFDQDKVARIEAYLLRAEPPKPKRPAARDTSPA